MTTTFASSTRSIDDEVLGPVLRPGDAEFAAEVSGWNLAVTPTPALVVGAMCAEDVAAAVRYAAEAGLRISVQATGHGLDSTLDNTVLITTSRLRGVSIDVATRTARVWAGTKWKDVIEAAAPHGLATMSGSSSDVGVVGYTLGGGAGPLGRRYGFAADHVISLQLVTADGCLREVTADSDPDLFWAIRGGKTGFGIVTAIEFELVPVARLYGGGIFFPGAAARELLEAYRTWVTTLSEDTTTSIAILRLPADPALPEPLRGQCVVHLRVAHLGSAEEGAALLAPMRAVAPALMDMVAEMPFAAVDSIHMDPVDPMPVWQEGGMLRELTSDTIDALLAVAGPDVEVPLVLAEVRHMGGAFARPAAVPNAVAGRSGAFTVLAIGPMFPPIAGIVPDICRAVIDAVAPWSAGTCLLNFAGSWGPERIAALWDDADRDRLARVRQAYDPAGTFAPANELSPTS